MGITNAPYTDPLKGYEVKLEKQRNQIKKLKDELSEMTQAVGLATTALPHMEIDPNSPISMMQAVVDEIDRLRGEVERLKEPRETQFGKGVAEALRRGEEQRTEQAKLVRQYGGTPVAVMRALQKCHGLRMEAEARAEKAEARCEECLPETCRQLWAVVEAAKPFCAAHQRAVFPYKCMCSLCKGIEALDALEKGRE